MTLRECECGKPTCVWCRPPLTPMTPPPSEPTTGETIRTRFNINAFEPITNPADELLLIALIDAALAEVQRERDAEKLEADNKLNATGNVYRRKLMAAEQREREAGAGFLAMVEAEPPVVPGGGYNWTRRRLLDALAAIRSGQVQPTIQCRYCGRIVATISRDWECSATGQSCEFGPYGPPAQIPERYQNYIQALELVVRIVQEYPYSSRVGQAIEKAKEAKG